MSTDSQQPMDVPSEMINETIGNVDVASTSTKPKKSSKKSAPTTPFAPDAAPIAAEEFIPLATPTKKSKKSSNKGIVAEVTDVVEAVENAVENVVHKVSSKKRKVSPATASEPSATETQPEVVSETPESNKPKKSRKKTSSADATSEIEKVVEKVLSIPNVPWDPSNTDAERKVSEQTLSKYLNDIKKRFDAVDFAKLKHAVDEVSGLAFHEYSSLKTQFDMYKSNSKKSSTPVAAESEPVPEAPVSKPKKSKKAPVTEVSA